jgi:soluble lytic murein transglycosylase-like protein
VDRLSRYWSLIDGSIRSWNLQLGVRIPRELVGAIILQESSGNPNASRIEHDLERSRGLMGVKDSTARDLGVADPTALYDPGVAIFTGTHYLALKVHQYGGRLPHAIAAYNAGSARFTQSEAFVNQAYVDSVVRLFRQLKVLPGGTALTAGAAVAGIGLAAWLATQAGWRRRKARG